VLLPCFMHWQVCAVAGVHQLHRHRRSALLHEGSHKHCRIQIWSQAA
jgi:hypothetical protein